MTFSVLAQCPRTGRLGIASASFSLGTGARASAIRAHVGVAKTQAAPNPEQDVRAVDLLAVGYRPARVLEIIGEQDPHWQFRQMGIIDRDGYGAAATGPRALQPAGQHAERGLVVLGNSVAGSHVIEGIVAGFGRSPEAELEERLLQALEGGRDAGGQARNGRPVPERSAVLRVVGWHDYLEVDLSVDQQQGAIDELRRVFVAWTRQGSEEKQA
jgi:uncharacterized Ntn-hydrolase superfamily protein